MSSKSVNSRVGWLIIGKVGMGVYGNGNIDSNGFWNNEMHEVSRPKTHSKGVTVISHLKPEGLKYNLTQTVIL